MRTGRMRRTLLWIDWYMWCTDTSRGRLHRGVGWPGQRGSHRNHRRVRVPDGNADYGEERWIGIGMLTSRVVVVVYTEPDDDSIRIISLGKALSHERRRYGQILRDQLGAR